MKGVGVVGVGVCRARELPEAACDPGTFTPPPSSPPLFALGRPGQVLAVAPADHVVLLRRADAFAHMGRFDDARRDLRAVIDAAPPANQATPAAVVAAAARAIAAGESNGAANNDACAAPAAPGVALPDTAAPAAAGDAGVPSAGGGYAPAAAVRRAQKQLAALEAEGRRSAKELQTAMAKGLEVKALRTGDCRVKRVGAKRWWWWWWRRRWRRPAVANDPMGEAPQPSYCRPIAEDNGADGDVRQIGYLNVSAPASATFVAPPSYACFIIMVTCAPGGDL